MNRHGKNTKQVSSTIYCQESTKFLLVLRVICVTILLNLNFCKFLCVLIFFCEVFSDFIYSYLLIAAILGSNVVTFSFHII